MSRFDNMQEVGLDANSVASEGDAMTRTPMLFALVAAAALAGCNKEDHTIVAGGPQEDPSTAVTNNEPVALPPSIQASKSYRCKDNKLVYIDWMSDGTARVKKTREEAGTSVTVGNELKGDAKTSTVTYNGESCKA